MNVSAVGGGLSLVASRYAHSVHAAPAPKAQPSVSVSAPVDADGDHDGSTSAGRLDVKA